MTFFSLAFGVDASFLIITINLLILFE